MNFFVWNARGLGSSSALNILQYYKRELNPKLMFLMETRCDHSKLEKLRLKLGYYGKLVVDCVGQSGGLCMFWSNDLVVELLTYSQAHIDVRIRQGDGSYWRFTGFYGHPVPSQRIHSWTLNRRLAAMFDLPWVYIGDFNEIQREDEKVGGGRKIWRDISNFREALTDSGLEDMGFLGPKFTWSNKREGQSMIMERLDRGTCNTSWKHLFPFSVVRHFELWGSNHKPLILEILDQPKVRDGQSM